MTTPPDRIPTLLKLLERDANDTFVLYALAMEHKKRSEYARALDYLERVRALDPEYSVAWLQAGQVHEAAGQMEQAREAYRQGIRVAAAKGDAHAKAEMEAALMVIE